MKKVVILLILISMLICPLCSCQQKNTTVGDVTGDLYFKDEDERFHTIVFDETPYNVYTPNLKGLYFYKSTDELITYVWGGGLTIYGLYAVDNPDFGTAFVATDVIMRLLGTPLSHPKYFLSGNTNIPELEAIAIEDIFHVTTVGFFIDAVYTEWSNVNELASSGWTDVYDRSLWNGENDTILLGELVDFSKPILLPDKYLSHDDIVFTPRDYESFFCGPFDLIEIDGDYYVRFFLPTYEDTSNLIYDEYVYKIRDEYQELFQ